MKNNGVALRIAKRQEDQHGERNAHRREVSYDAIFDEEKISENKEEKELFCGEG